MSQIRDLLDEVRSLEERFLEDPEHKEGESIMSNPGDLTTHPDSADAEEAEEVDDIIPDVPIDQVLDGKSAGELSSYLDLCLKAIEEGIENSKEIIVSLKSGDLENEVLTPAVLDRINGIVDKISDLLDAVESEEPEEEPEEPEEIPEETPEETPEEPEEET